MGKIRACIFDVGGVILSSPLNAIKAWEKRNGLPDAYLSLLIEGQGTSSAFQKLERSEVSMAKFNKLFHSELNDVETGNRYYKEYCTKRGKQVPKLPTSLSIDAPRLHVEMTGHLLTINQDYVKAIGRIRAAGIKTAALTNNHKNEDSRGNTNIEQVRQLFDYFIESSVVGLRKPDPRFYEHALKEIGVKADEAVFLDDLGPNLKGARQLGIHTIHVKLGRESDALIELGKFLDIDLLDRSASKL